MTYPGTKERVPTALESGLIQRVVELERELAAVEAARKRNCDSALELKRERDELVEGVILMTRYMQYSFMQDVYDNAVNVTPTSTVAVVRKLLSRYPRAGQTQTGNERSA